MHAWSNCDILQLVIIPNTDPEQTSGLQFRGAAMSRAIATTAGLFGYRRAHCRRTVVVFLLVVGTVIGVFSLRGHDRVQAQGAPARQPGLEPAPFPQFGRYEIMCTSIAYYFFTTDGRAVLQFPGRPLLILAPGEAEGVRAFSQRPPNPFLPQRIGRDGRYFINVGEIQYWENNAGGATVHFSNCPSIKDLTAEEATHLRHLADQLLATVIEGPNHPQNFVPSPPPRRRATRDDEDEVPPKIPVAPDGPPAPGPGVR
jgi:hypothetical protein